MSIPMQLFGSRGPLSVEAESEEEESDEEESDDDSNEEDYSDDERERRRREKEAQKKNKREPPTMKFRLLVKKGNKPQSCECYCSSCSASRTSRTY